MIIVEYNNLLNVISLNERKKIHQIPLSIDCFAVNLLLRIRFFLGGLINDIMIYRCDNFKNVFKLLKMLMMIFLLMFFLN